MSRIKPGLFLAGAYLVCQWAIPFLLLYLITIFAYVFNSAFDGFGNSPAVSSPVLQDKIAPVHAKGELKPTELRTRDNVESDHPSDSLQYIYWRGDPDNDCSRQRRRTCLTMDRPFRLILLTLGSKRK